MKSIGNIGTAAAGFALLFAQIANAQEYSAGSMARGSKFPFQGGQALFKGICQGCHMADASGAVGAGRYPALANDGRLAVAGYPVAVILHGQKAMPAFDEMLNDRQIADVVNFVRTNFGNHYADAASPADVASARR